MQNILIVSEVQSYLLVSLQEKLAEVNCKVMNVQANPDLLSKIKEELDMIFIFGTEDLLNQRQGLTYLRNCRKITAQTSKPFMMYDHP